MADPLARCPRCGAPFNDAAGPLCPACLLKAALEAEPGGETEWSAAGETRLTSNPLDRTGETRLFPAGSAAATRPRALHALSDTIGPYRLVRVLGEGGMGVVYLAEQTEPIRRTVALKVIKLGMDTREVVARFESERQALALMDHPNIARVIDAGATPDGRPFFVMEHVDGVPITDYCDAHRLSTRARLALVATICGAMQHAHQKGVIHRDLKPSNVLVAEQDGTPVPKIIDFGIAKATHQPLTERTMFTEQGQFIGTPEYMSPEQTGVGGVNVDATTDIYSLGVLLYELLAGALPFEPAALRKAGYAEMQRIIREDEPPKPSTRVSGLGATATDIAQRRQTDSGGLRRQLAGDLDWITLKAIEKDRERRYASASEFAADITRYLRDEAVLASPPSTAYRAQKFVRRNRLAVTAAAIVAVAIMGGFIASTILYYQADLERRNANAQKAQAETARGEAAARAESEAHQRQLAQAATKAETTARTEAEAQRREALLQAYSANLAAANSGLEAMSRSGMTETRDLVFHLLDADPSLRNWEWNFLGWRVDSSVAHWYAPKLSRGAITFSADGRQVYWGNEHAIAGWRMDTFDRTMYLSEEDPIVATGGDAGLIARLHGDREIRLIDFRSRIVARIGPLEQPVAAVTLGPNSTVAVATTDGIVSLWRSTGERLRSFSTLSDRPSSLQFSPDGALLLARTRTTPSAQILMSDGSAAGRPVPSLKPGGIARFSADGSALFVGRPGSLRFIDTRTGEETGSISVQESISSMAVSRDGKWLATGGGAGIRLWSVGRPLLAAPPPASLNSRVGSLAFTLDGRYLVGGDDDGQLILWDAPRIEWWLGVDVVHSHQPTKVYDDNAGDRLSLSPTARWAVSPTRTGIGAWALDKSDNAAYIEARLNPSTICAVAVNDAGAFVAGLSDGTVHIRHPGSADTVTPMPSFSGAIAAVAVSANGQSVAGLAISGQLRVWEAASGRLLFESLAASTPPKGRWVRGDAACAGFAADRVSFDASGSRVMTYRLSADFTPTMNQFDSPSALRTWLLPSPKVVQEFSLGAIDIVSFSPDGSRWIVVSGRDQTRGNQIEIRGADGAVLASSVLRAGMKNAAFSSDGSRIAITDAFADRISIVDGRNAKSLIALENSASKPVSVAFSSDGVELVVGYADGTVRKLPAKSSFVIDRAVSEALDPFNRVNPRARVSADLTLTPEDVARADQWIAQWEDRDPDERLNARSWSVLQGDGHSSAQYAEALRMAESALELSPWSPEYVGTAGVAELRLHHFDRATELLAKSLQRWSDSGAAWLPPASDFYLTNGAGQRVAGGPARRQVLASVDVVRAFRALGLAKLDRQAEARAELEVVRTRSRSLPGDERLTRFFHEAEDAVCALEARLAEDRSAYQRARTLSDSLFTELTFSDDVVDRLQSMVSISGPEREAAVRLARARLDDPAALNLASWNVVKKAGAPADVYVLALKHALKADALAPNQAGVLNTLALAEYRQGRYKDALETAAKAASCRPPTASALQKAGDTVISVLARLRLNQIESARTDLDTLVGLKNVGDDLKSLVGEARSLSESLRMGGER